jgi:hypothetical protein
VSSPSAKGTQHVFYVAFIPPRKIARGKEVL